MSEWIKVNDRLPEDKQKVLVYIPSINPHYGIQTAFFRQGIEHPDPIPLGTVIKWPDKFGSNEVPYRWETTTFGLMPGGWLGQEVSHWMPLPDKPMEV